MPLFNETDDQTTPSSVSYSLKMAFKNYEIAINKYENLLVETTALNVSIKEKLSQLPVEEEVEKIVETFIDKADLRMKQQQDKLDITENMNKTEKENLIKLLNSNISTMLFRLNVVLAWLTIITVVGSAAFGYTELRLRSDLNKQAKEIIDTRGPLNNPNAKAYWVDERGIKRYIEIEEHKSH